MKNLTIQFAYPWLLLLLIPAVGLTMFSYFRLHKRYRKTRNRITSIVLHLLVMFLSIFTLGGMMFHYDVPNEENEIIVLVDVSDTEKSSAIKRDQFVDLVLTDCSYDNFKVGVVTFGFDQEYAVPMTYEVGEIYDAYMDATLPDTSATNVAAALEYTRNLFTNPQTGKIVLITDGKETDEEALDVIRTITAQGTRVDVANITSSYEGEDVQLIDVALPDYHINPNEECTITLTVESNVETSVTVQMYDNGQLLGENSEKAVDLLANATTTVEFKHSFADGGLHELVFQVEASSADLVLQNNTYTSFVYLDVYNDILIVERMQGESTALVSMLNEDNEEPYNVTVKCVADEDFPMTTTALRVYDQVILNNISNEDMPEGFDVVLQEYVQKYGGGLFTVGGNDEAGEANAYNRSDLLGTLYQEMLPVEAINYTPPLGVVVLIDRSGSMSATDNYGITLLEWAQAATNASLQALSERDYIGIMSLDDNQEVILPMTPKTQYNTILDAIDSITVDDANGGTVYPGAIYRAGQALIALNQVSKRHIILISDGQVGDDQVPAYEKYIKDFYELHGITFSVIGVQMNEGSEEYNRMQRATEIGHGRVYVSTGDRLLTDIKEDLNSPSITEVIHEQFNPSIYDPTSPLIKGLRRMEDNSGKLDVTLDGFYGVKARASADLILTGEFEVPLYAQWKYGKGTVGSFMCDLQASAWSSSFMNDDIGIAFIRRVVNNLMPMEEIEVRDIDYTFKEDNYTNQLNVFANLNLNEGESIVGTIVNTKTGEESAVSMNALPDPNDEQPLRDKDVYILSPFSELNGYSSCDFVIKTSGVYKITLEKYKNGQPVPDVSITFYKSVTYSEEYDTTPNLTNEELNEMLATLAEKGNGALIEDLNNPKEILEGFVTSLHRTFDPRFLFMIIAIVAFLLDIAVRKFKFKWPHELIRDYRAKKNQK